MDADRSRGRDGCDPDHILTLTGRVSRGEGQQLGSELVFSATGRKAWRNWSGVAIYPAVDAAVRIKEQI
jgi:hypothetical protein